MINKNTNRLICSTVVLKTLLCFSMFVLSQHALIVSAEEESIDDDSKVEVNTIIVTAERREQSLQDTAVAVTAFSGDYIEQARIENASDLVGHVPGLHLAPFSRIQALPTLRGAQSGEDGPGLDQPVAFFVDDVYKGRVTDWDLALFDVERIEVLRGPQGTLFGRNVVGGLINVVTRKPTEYTRMLFEVGTGRFGLFDLKGVISGALSVDNNLSGSFAFSHKTRDGFTTNVTTGNKLDSIDKNSFKGQLRYTPSEDFDALLQFDYLTDTGYGQHRDYLGVASDSVELVNFVPDTDPSTSHIAFDGGVDRTAWGGALTLDWDFGSSQLKSITSYYEDEAFLPETDLLAIPAPSFWETNEYDLTQTTQEFRLQGDEALDGKLQWVTGLYFLNIDHRQKRTFFNDFVQDSFLGEIDFSIFGDSILRTFFSDQTVETKSASVFFQTTYSFTDDFRLTTGGRYTSDKKSGTLTNMGNTFIFAGAGEFTVPQSAKFTAFTPRITLEMDISDDIMAYATYSEGFKSGGFTSNGLDAPEFFQVPIKPEKAINYELGLRSSWLENRLVANVTAYSVDYTNLQVSQLLADGTFLQTNAGKAEAKGVDLELTAAVTEGLTAWFNYSYFDGEYTDFGDFTGNSMVAPPHAYTAGITYAMTVSDGVDLDFRLDVQHKDEYFQDPANEAGIVNSLDSIVNFSMTLYTSDDWQFTLWGKNLRDERAFNYLNDASVFILTTAQVEAGQQVLAANYIPPRTWGISARYTLD